jgi:Domain of unknown function (DUF697)
MTRKPAAFRLDDPHVIVADDETRGARGTVRVVPQPENFDLPVPVEAPLPAKRRFPWGTIFWSALGGLVLLGAGLATTALIEDLYARATWLGTFGAALAALAGLSLLVLCIREIAGLFRLASIEKLRARADLALVEDDRDAARAIVRELTAKLSATPQLARSRSELQTHLTEIIDGRDLLHIAERGLMAPLDQEASRLVARTATRVSLVTAVSPRAAVDLAFVLFAALGMIRRQTLCPAWRGRAQWPADRPSWARGHGGGAPLALCGPAEAGALRHRRRPPAPQGRDDTRQAHFGRLDCPRGCLGGSPCFKKYWCQSIWPILTSLNRHSILPSNLHAPQAAQCG